MFNQGNALVSQGGYISNPKARAVQEKEMAEYQAKLKKDIKTLDEGLWQAAQLLSRIGIYSDTAVASGPTSAYGHVLEAWKMLQVYIKRNEDMENEKEI